MLELAQKAHQYITTKLATTKNVSQLDQSSPEQQQQSQQQQQQQPQQPQQTEQISEIKKGLDLNKLELSESERLLAEQDNEFKEQCNIRKDAIIKLNQLKEAKREIEQKLTELDCQRMKLLGKDRLTIDIGGLKIMDCQICILVGTIMMKMMMMMKTMTIIRKMKVK